MILALALAVSAAAAQPKSVGCIAVAAEAVTAERLASELRPAAAGEGAAVPLLAPEPGVSFDLGESRRAKLRAYVTRECRLGISQSVTGGFESSSPDPDSALSSFAEAVARHAPDWSVEVTTRGAIALTRGTETRATSVRELLQLRIDAGTPVELGGVRVRAVYDGWLLFLVPEDPSRSLMLSVVSTVHPWAYYDLAPYGLPRLLVRFDERAVARLWVLPAR